MPLNAPTDRETTPAGDTASLTQETTEVRAGRVFAGRYRADRVVKSGQGIETIFATDLTYGHPVVIKTASDESVSVAARMRLEHEAGVLRQLRSPWFAALQHFGREENLLFLVMPHVPGITLQARIALAPLSVRDTLTVGKCLMTGLEAAHEHGVLHRDLKPANIIVDEEVPLERATIIDFGLARSSRLDSSIRDQPVGTARYMSPEQAGLLDHEVDERSDLYSAGVVLFECLAGRPPFLGESVGEVLRQHLTVKPPELRSLGIALPRALDEIIQRLLRKDPRDRYQSAEAVLHDLNEISDALDRGVSDPTIVVGMHDRRRTLTEPAFVGRGNELSELGRQLDRAREGHGGLIILEAESGGGKTRLLAEFARRSTLANAWVLNGQGLDQAAQRPFQVLVGVAEEIVAACRLDPALAAMLRERLGEQRGAVCAALPELAEVLGGEDATLGPDTFGQVRSVQALAALLDVLGTADRPALVVLDDCQWADEMTQRLFAAWQKRRDEAASASRNRHAVLVIAFRSDDVAPGHPLRSLRPSSHLRLPPFAPEDVRLLAESMAGPLPEEAIQVVERLSEGSPFMAGAVLQGMVECGALTADHAGWRVDPLALADVQSSRHAAAFLSRRMDRLPAEAIRLLSAAAVLGKEFELDLAAELSGQSAADAVAALDEARRRHIVHAKPEQTRCFFLHDKLRQTLLDRLPDAERQSLHLRAAERLLDRLQLPAGETRGSPDEQAAKGPARQGIPPERCFQLAYHFDAAGEPRRALPYAVAAARQAEKQHSLEIAEQQYRIAQRGLESGNDQRRLAVAEGLGNVLMLRGRYENAESELRTARALVKDRRDQARLDGMLGELAFKRGDMKTAGECIERGLRALGRWVPSWTITFVFLVVWEALVQLFHTLFPRLFLARRRLEDAGDDLLAVRLYSRIGHFYWFHRGSIPTLWAHLRDMNLAERYPPTPELAQAWSEHAPAMSMLPCYSRGIAYAEKSLAIRRALGDLWGQGQTLHFYGIVLYAASRYEECIVRCREAIRLLERTGDYWELNMARYQLAASLYRLGDLQGALEEAKRMHRSGLDLGDAQASGISLDLWAFASLGRVPADAIQTELARPRGDVQRIAQVLTAEGRRLIAAGKYAEAAEVFGRARRISRKDGVKNAWVAPCYPWLATALRLQWGHSSEFSPVERAKVLRRARRAARAAVHMARYFQNDLPHALRERGLVEALHGQADRARRYLDESIAVAERQGAKYELAQTRLARGLVGQAYGWEHAREELEQGKQTVREIEAPVGGSGAGDSPADSSSRPVTLSLADRFDTVLDQGRRIASALSRDAIFAGVKEAALKLLRSERCLILELRDPDTQSAASSAELQSGYSGALVRRAIAHGRAVAFIEGMPDDSESVILSGIRSAICAPIFARGKAVACFYASHHQVGGLFGEVEKRLADFIAVIAGAALENAEGFAELRRLNKALEERIAEQKRAEKRIQEQAALLDKAQDAILVQDLEGRILYWNRSAERLYGWSADEVRSKQVQDLVYRGVAAQYNAACQATFDKGEWTGELSQVTKSGKEITVESRWTLVRDDDGRPKSKLVVNTDVTEKKNLETQFFRMQRLESIGTLASGIAHDMNNVLTPIMMGMDLLKMRVQDAQAQTILHDLRGSAQRGADMVKQILSFAKGVKGQKVELHLRPVIREVEKMLERTIPKGINIRSSVPQDSWIVRADPTQLHQMVMNLCVNARDAMPQGGTLTVAAVNLHLDESAARAHLEAKPGPYVLLTVTDTGTGMPPDIVAKIFDPFFTTKAPGKGTGLGLSTVMGIVKGLGGFLEVKSEVGKGTTFAVYLPAIESAKPVEQAEGTKPLPMGQGECVLVIDDEAGTRQIIKQTLEAHGYQVILAEDGLLGLAAFEIRRDRIDVVITDLLMPGLDGSAVIQAMLERNPETKIIGCTGLAEGVRADVPPAGVKAFIPKPFTTEKLLTVLDEVLRGAKSPFTTPAH